MKSTELTTVMAGHDRLTGQLDRQKILAELKTAIIEADPTRPEGVVFLLSMDGFREVNESFGHLTGDRLLCMASERLRGLTGERDCLGRIGGDEFLLILRGIDLPSSLPELMAQVGRALDHSFMLGELEIRLTTSIGCAIISDPSLRTHELLHRAEAAMTLVKQGVRKGVALADEQLLRKIEHDHRLTLCVREAIGAKRIFLAVQPIVDPVTCSLRAAEALLRLRDIDGTVLPAAEILDTLRRARSVSTVDELVMAEAVLRLREFSMSSPTKGFRLSINIDASLLAARGEATRILNHLAVACVPTSLLMIELAEHRGMPGTALFQENLRLLHEAGVSLCLDNFASGATNLHLLGELPLDAVKIDMSLFPLESGEGSSVSKKSLTLLRELISMARHLGHRVYLKRVETEVQRDILRDIGCDGIQGFLTGIPVEWSEFLKQWGDYPNINGGKDDKGVEIPATP